MKYGQVAENNSQSKFKPNKLNCIQLKVKNNKEKIKLNKVRIRIENKTNFIKLIKINLFSLKSKKTTNKFCQ